MRVPQVDQAPASVRASHVLRAGGDLLVFAHGEVEIVAVGVEPVRTSGGVGAARQVPLLLRAGTLALEPVRRARLRSSPFPHSTSSPTAFIRRSAFELETTPLRST